MTTIPIPELQGRKALVALTMNIGLWIRWIFRIRSKSLSTTPPRRLFIADSHGNEDSIRSIMAGPRCPLTVVLTGELKGVGDESSKGTHNGK